MHISGALILHDFDTIIINEYMNAFAENLQESITICKDISDRFSCNKLILIGDKLTNHALEESGFECQYMSIEDFINLESIIISSENNHSTNEVLKIVGMQSHYIKIKTSHNKIINSGCFIWKSNVCFLPQFMLLQGIYEISTMQTQWELYSCVDGDFFIM